MKLTENLKCKVTRYSFVNVLLFTLFAGFSAASFADELRVFSAAAVQAPVEKIVQEFERKTGHTVHVEFATAGGVDNKVKAALKIGTPVDLVLNGRERLETMQRSGEVNPIAPRDLGVVQIGVAMRHGATRPDLSNMASFRAALVNADTIAYADPAKGATTGIHFANMIARMGLTESLKAKSLLVANGIEVMKLVQQGKAELGVTQISEILHVQGDAAVPFLVGALPTELQLNSTYSLSFGSSTPSVATQQLADRLLNEAARERFKQAGFL